MILARQPAKRLVKSMVNTADESVVLNETVDESVVGDKQCFLRAVQQS